LMADSLFVFVRINFQLLRKAKDQKRCSNSL
jgi:hypothetical protein